MGGGSRMGWMDTITSNICGRGVGRSIMEIVRVVEDISKIGTVKAGEDISKSRIRRRSPKSETRCRS